MKAVSVVNAFANVMATPAQIKQGGQAATIVKEEHKGLYRLKHMPRGSAALVYWAAVLEVNGAFSKKSKVIKKEELEKFFTGGHVDKMIACRVLEETPNGVRLSKDGYEYMHGMLFGEPKREAKNKTEVARLVLGLTRGEVPKDKGTKLFKGNSFVPAE
jgi:hypothetical protein